MKKKLILFSSIFALVLSFVFLIPSNKVHADEEVLSEEEVDELYDSLWEVANESRDDYYNSYKKIINNTYKGHFDDFLEDGTIEGEVFNNIWEAGFFYWFDSCIDSSDYYFRKVVSDFTVENWCDYASYYGLWLAAETLYFEYDYCDTDVMYAVNDLISAYCELTQLYDSYYFSDKGYADGFDDGFKDGSLNSVSSTIKNLFLGKTISLRNFDDPSSYLCEESDMLINDTFFINNQLFFDDYLYHCEEFIPDDFFEGHQGFYIRIDFNGLDTSLFEITTTFNNSFVQHEFEFYFTDGTSKIITRNLEDFITFEFDVHKQIDYILISCMHDYFPSSFIATNDYDKYLEGFEDGYHKGNTDGYLEGVNTGHDSGYHKGFNDGKLEGANDGYDSGYHKGFNDGFNDKNPIRLDYLFWTIAGLPFETVKTIWDFEFLGVNLANFFTGLLMSLVAIWFVKKFLLK